MAEGSRKMALVGGDPTARLTDDILADIISRVPYKSTCCCKCVSTRWRDLISHPYHRKKMPQSLIGFFYKSRGLFKSHSGFTNVSGKGDPLVDPSLLFLPKFKILDIVDCCNGLLLCAFSNDLEKLLYVVCNPATEKWVVVPGTDSSRGADARLAFDPAVSSHFHVCEFVDGESWAKNKFYIGPYDCIAAVVIYSSKTGVWSHSADGWMDYGIKIPFISKTKSVFFKGVLYLCAFDHELVALDVEENNWKVIPLSTPEYRGYAYDIYLSQGQLYFAHEGDSELSIWALEDPSSENWNLKHNVSHLEMFRTEYSAYESGYSVFSIHPEHSLIFLACRYEETLMSYNMDSRELCILCQLGRDGEIHWNENQYLPYVPLYSELLADEH